MKMLIPRGDEIAAAERAVRPRAALLALASELDEVGIRSRLADDGLPVDGVLPAVLRCWNPAGTASILIACLWDEAIGLRLRRLPSGNDLGDAAAMLQPGGPVRREIAAMVSAMTEAEGQ
ncbi:hypothetical protein ACGFNU_05695 [Spirillospora sp. NPDC048911]|uniref:hypothetical protein n=1 Tax=Spirillospora sp. NPDC048911 TaxID=3364527 RepID=UPI00371CCD28